MNLSEVKCTWNTCLEFRIGIEPLSLLENVCWSLKVPMNSLACRVLLVSTFLRGSNLNVHAKPAKFMLSGVIIGI
jgi:hypothetical protein